MRCRLPLALVSIIALGSCATPDDVAFRIVEALKLAPPECTGGTAVPRDDVTLFDIGLDVASANSATAILRLDLDDIDQQQSCAHRLSPCRSTCAQAV